MRLSAGNYWGVYNGSFKALDSESAFQNAVVTTGAHSTINTLGKTQADGCSQRISRAQEMHPVQPIPDSQFRGTRELGAALNTDFSRMAVSKDYVTQNPSE